jgi:dTDP-4-dehydrorhamnose reductase
VTILIAGGRGRLGRELTKVFEGSIAPLREELDVRDVDSTTNAVKRYNPEILINCAALAGIPVCENNQALAYQTNVVGTRNLVQACAKNSPHCYFVHISTPCVFSGKEGGYSEDSLPYPQNFYGISKLLSEYEVAMSNLDRKLIIRCNFVPRERWPYPKAFTDRFGTYLFSDILAESIRSTIASRPDGIVHICGDRRLSMFELAKITTPEVLPMTLLDYTGPHLTRDMTLTSKRIPAFEFK